MLRVRTATEADLPFLLELRNDPASVRFSKRGVLSAAALKEDYLRRSDKHAFVVVRTDGRGAERAVGYAVFERLGEDRAEISIALAPAARGRGLARPLIQVASAHAAEHHGFAVIRADIDPANTPSRRAFRGAGYRPVPAASVGATAALERYELRVASRRSGAGPRDPARGLARPRPAPPPRD